MFSTLNISNFGSLADGVSLQKRKKKKKDQKKKKKGLQSCKKDCAKLRTLKQCWEELVNESIHQVKRILSQFF